MKEASKYYGCQSRYTQKELESYRQWLAELDEEAHGPGGDLRKRDDDIWTIFNPAHWSGQQIYESFTDEELLDIVIRTMNHHGHRPDFEDIHYIYLKYLKDRFGSQDKIKVLAKTRLKNLRNEQAWPVDWPDRVSPAPVLEHPKKHPFTEDDAAMLKNICERVHRSASLPDLTPEEKARLDKLGGVNRILKEMGIPALKERELLHMKKYWQEERKRQAAEAATANAEEKK